MATTDVRTIGFLKVIQEELFAGNEFIMNSISHDNFVKDKTVEIPQSGAVPDIQEDRTVYPIPVVQRADTKKSYDLIEFSGGSVRISDADYNELSYDVKKSILQQMINQLNDRIGLRSIYNWGGAGLITATNGQIVETTGTATSNIAPPSGTSTRKSVAYEDLLLLAKKLDKDHCPRNNRYLLMPSDMYWDMLRENPELLNKDYMNTSNLPMGVVQYVAGFNIMLRPYTAVYTNATTPIIKAVGATPATDDNWAAIAWQSDFVAKALGQIKVYADINSATYQGDVYSSLVRFNNTQLRTDGKGLVTLVQSS